MIWQTLRPCEGTWSIAQMYMQLPGLYRQGKENMEELVGIGVQFVIIKKGKMLFIVLMIWKTQGPYEGTWFIAL